MLRDIVNVIRFTQKMSSVYLMRYPKRKTFLKFISKLIMEKIDLKHPTWTPFTSVLHSSWWFTSLQKASVTVFPPK